MGTKIHLCLNRDSKLVVNGSTSWKDVPKDKKKSLAPPGGLEPGKDVSYAYALGLLDNLPPTS